MPPGHGHSSKDDRLSSSRSGQDGVRGPRLTRIGIPGGIRHDTTERIAARAPTRRKNAVLNKNGVLIE
ncbi:hypothetical protein OCH239_04470 [Roseivivax halodurans JCM 10272]|uniref:Uncharacterized protein n=1 Tax=Roseivivax halodurans JCM 10272 TaxID=1449350 RepID=X7E0S5_9RHOB|nr:hypothetical protein OCH239_04470 [Roseivivax halodurans JCM 10272]